PICASWSQRRSQIRRPATKVVSANGRVGQQVGGTVGAGGNSMIRKAAAVVVVLCLSSASLHADSTKLTVSAASASVYKSPSVGSPVIGQAARGTALEVTREVGDWVKVTWPNAPDGIGYVRANMGQISHGGATAAAARPGASTAARPATAAAATP